MWSLEDNVVIVKIKPMQKELALLKAETSYKHNIMEIFG